MKTIRDLLICMALLSSAVFADEVNRNAENLCRTFVLSDENYKVAHENVYCLKAAETGSGQAQYSVGMGYGFSGNHELEEQLYRMAAAKGVIAAYLSLGHLLRNNRQEEAIIWYERYIEAKGNGYGYAALQLVGIYKDKGEDYLMQKWLKVCQSSSYAKHCTLK